MAELHKFRDDVKSETGRVKPISARHLDDNFKVVRLKIADALATLLKISEQFPQQDELDLNVANSGKFLVTIQNGSIVLVTVPEDETQFFNGNMSFTASEECPP